MSVTHFITGHLDISDAEFTAHYVPQLQQALKEPDSQFVMGAAPGVDTRARQWLIAEGVSPKRITVYILERFMEAVNITDGCNIIVAFPSHETCDQAMSAVSHYCIAWVRPEAEQRAIIEAMIARGEIPGPYRKRVSATERNIHRRRQSPLQYWHDGKLLTAPCSWNAVGVEKWRWTNQHVEPRECVTMKERKGPGDVTVTTICRSCLDANFGYIGEEPNLE
jgi:hypothetical protein